MWSALVDGMGILSEMWPSKLTEQMRLSWDIDQASALLGWIIPALN